MYCCLSVQASIGQMTSFICFYFLFLIIYKMIFSLYIWINLKKEEKVCQNFRNSKLISCLETCKNKKQGPFHQLNIKIKRAKNKKRVVTEMSDTSGALNWKTSDQLVPKLFNLLNHKPLRPVGQWWLPKSVPLPSRLPASEDSCCCFDPPPCSYFASFLHWHLS